MRLPSRSDEVSEKEKVDDCCKTLLLLLLLSSERASDATLLVLLMLRERRCCCCFLHCWLPAFLIRLRTLDTRDLGVRDCRR